MKFCVDCKWYKEDLSALMGGDLTVPTYQKCHHDNNKSPVDGKPDYPPRTLREDAAKCGREGKWWTKKEDGN